MASASAVAAVPDAVVPDAASPLPEAAAPWPRPWPRACQYSIPASEAVTVRLACRSSTPRPRSICPPAPDDSEISPSSRCSQPM
jgi:hypothetical protein